MSCTQISHVNINPSVYVVEQIPPDVIGVLVNHKVLSAVPAPILTDRPIPVRYLKVEATGEPETMTVAVKACDPVAIAGPETPKMPMLEGMIHMEAMVVGTTTNGTAKRLFIPITPKA